MMPQFSVDDMTSVQAMEYLVGRSGTFRFNQVVMVVTMDSVFWCSAAQYEKLGHYHFVWTEHNGDTYYHEDEVLKVHVVSPTPSQVYVEQCVRRLDT